MITTDRNRRFGVRLLVLTVAVSATALLAACGGAETQPAAPGTPENPLVGKPTDANSSARTNEGQSPAAKSSQPGYEKLVERQTSNPRSRFTPCNLVTRAQATAILGGPVQAPLEAPQGPTCIYRSQSGKTFITLAVQSLDIDRVKKQMRQRQAVDVANRTAYCGTYGQPMLYVALSQKRVLSVAAPCAVAKQFAARAVSRLSE
jgi:hypothetical protein